MNAPTTPGTAGQTVLAARLEAEHHARRIYLQGLWRGFSAGLMVGCCSVGLLALLLWAITRAALCPQC